MKEKFIALFNAVENEMRKQRDFGAQDTEPDIELQVAMVKALDGRIEIPQTGDDWQLFTSSMDCEEAAKKLTMATQPLIQFIADNHHSQEIVNLVRDFCWRIY